jgi:signal peptidase I
MSWLLLGGLAGSVAGLAVAAVVTARRAFAVVTVTGSSMTPRYRHGDRVLVRRSGRVRPGAVVVARLPRPPRAGDGVPPDPLTSRGLVIKRVAAVPGDAVPAPVRARVAATRGDLVPAGRLVLLGDNEHSVDSRTVGYFPVEAVLAVVVRDLTRRR